MVRNWFIWVTALLFPFAVLTQLMPVPDVHGETAPVASASATAAATTTADQVTATQAAAASAAAASASATQPVTTQTPAAQLPVAKAEATQPAAVEDAAKAQQQTTTPPDQLVDASTAADQGSSSAPTTTSTSGLTSAQGAGQTAPTESGDSTEDEPAVPTVPNEPGYLDDGSPKAVDPIEIPVAPMKARRAPAAPQTRSTGTIGVDHPTAEGEVMLFKQATPVTGMVNTWDVTLRIEGKDVESTADVVLVIDTSGSMRGNRLTTAKQAANSFIDKLLPSDKIRIGIVSFQSDATVPNQLTSQPAGLHTTVNNLAATGGTFTQAAIRRASTMLASSTADHKHIVLLSDGEPTYSYALNNPDTHLIDYPGHGRQTSANALQSDYNYGTRVGVGTSMWYRYSNNGTWWNPSDDKYYNHGNSAIAEAGFTKAAAAQPYLWTIALELGNQGQAVLEAMASPGGFRTSDAAQLNQVFNSIADLIRAAVRGSTVTDPMGIGFQIPNASIGSISASQGTATYDSGTKTISWNPGDLVTPISQGSDIKYAQLTYRIEINDDILNQTPDGNGTYPTNGNATVTYTDANGTQQTGTFPVPTVNPVLYKVKKVLVGSDLGPLVQDRNFTVEVTGPGTAAPTSTTRSYTLNAANTTTRLITDLRYASTYTFAEVGDLGDYQVSYQVNGTPTTDLSFFIANDQTDDVTITVTNVYEPAGLTLTKRLTKPAPVSDGIDVSSFTLKAALDDANTVEGSSGVTKTPLKPGFYALSETPPTGDASKYYVQDGGWACTDNENNGATVAVTDTDDSPTVELAKGQQVTCTVTNATAALTLLKSMPDGVPAPITLTATPVYDAGATVLDLKSLTRMITKQDAEVTFSEANTIQVRPGHSYELAESVAAGSNVAFLRNGLERYTGPDPANPDMTNAAHWVSVDSATVTVDPGEHAIYRFVNRTAPAVPIPLTGGTGRTAFLAASAALAIVAATTIAMAVRRRTTRLA